MSYRLFDRANHERCESRHTTDIHQSIHFEFAHFARSDVASFALERRWRPLSSLDVKLMRRENGGHGSSASTIYLSVLCWGVRIFSR